MPHHTKKLHTSLICYIYYKPNDWFCNFFHWWDRIKPLWWSILRKYLRPNASYKGSRTMV